MSLLQFNYFRKANPSRPLPGGDKIIFSLLSLLPGGDLEVGRITL